MPATVDPGAVRAILNTDRAWSVYALGDLAPGLAEHAEWHLAPDGTPALVLVYRGFAVPVLFAFGAPEAVRPLLAAAAAEPRFYLSIRPEILPLIRERFSVQSEKPMWRMVLDQARFQPPGGAGGPPVRLGPAALPALEALYADGAEAGQAPDFFSAEMVAGGVFFGQWEGVELVAAAGTHLVAPSEGVAAVGNVYTRRDWRGRGLAGRLTAAVAAELLRQHPGLTVALNVSQTNRPAIAAYERVGFNRYCAFLEGEANRVP